MGLRGHERGQGLRQGRSEQKLVLKTDRAWEAIVCEKGLESQQLYKVLAAESFPGPFHTLGWTYLSTLTGPWEIKSLLWSHAKTHLPCHKRHLFTYFSQLFAQRVNNLLLEGEVWLQSSGCISLSLVGKGPGGAAPRPEARDRHCLVNFHTPPWKMPSACLYGIYISAGNKRTRSLKILAS